MKHEPYVITLTEIHEFEYQCHALNEHDAVNRLKNGITPHNRKKVLDRTIEVRKNCQPKHSQLKRYFK